MAVRARMAAANRALHRLSLPQIQEWDQFADRYNLVARFSFGLSQLSASAIFTGFATKWLQAQDGLTGSANELQIPLTPPQSPTVGDNIILVPSSPAPGVVRLTASQPNATGMACESLLQPLTSANRKPRDGHYRTAGFHVFATGSLTADFQVLTRFVAVAFRFVCIATGQSTGVIPIGVVQVAA
ncbi:MAG: hypothetical protein K8R88_11240 [Armatimonadetes bacterium]|nr:hypothetical protein [Armatimonadota bacterium]